MGCSYGQSNVQSESGSERGGGGGGASGHLCPLVVFDDLCQTFRPLLGMVLLCCINSTGFRTGNLKL